MTDIDEARRFLADHHRGVLATYRRDGKVQQSPVTAGLDEQGRVIISVTEDRAKARNARRDPRVSLCVFNDAFYGAWVQVEGTVELVDGPDRIDALVDYYRRLSGEHPDWDDSGHDLESSFAAWPSFGGGSATSYLYPIPLIEVDGPVAPMGTLWPAPYSGIRSGPGCCGP
jgi:PPOX class probable F420-dependent enzyme